MNNFQDKANFIWQVADDILRGSFKQHEYGDVIFYRRPKGDTSDYA